MPKGVMLTDREISEADIDTDVARVALEQCERRLADKLDVRKSLEAKYTGLFSAYVGLTMAICGIGAALAQRAEFRELAPRLFAAALPLGLGACIFVIGLWPTKSGFLGAAPSDWLRREWIAGPKDGLAHIFAHQVNNVRVRLAVAERDLARKQYLLIAGLACGIAGMLSVGLTLYLTLT